MEYTYEQIYAKLNLVLSEMERVIIGKRQAAVMLLVGMLSGGHVLIEDVPGTGKTTMATVLGKVTGLKFKRAQFTPDVMASDITGFTIYNKASGKFEYRPGMVMTNILLADEINRTSPKTQSALLEAMEEKNVTVDGTTHVLPRPFMVIATQNEVGYVGTFPLPEAQLDRFMLKLTIGYPTVEQEMNIISDRRTGNPADEVQTVLSSEEILACMQAVKNVNVDPAVERYIVKTVAETRTSPHVILGASPRASLALMRTSQALSFISGRGYVTPEDVKNMVPFVLSHRIHLKQESRIRGVTVEDVLSDISRAVMPPIRKGVG